jgi:protein SCO1
MKKIFLPLFLTLIIASCAEKMPVIDDLGNAQYKLVDQNNRKVFFPEFVKGKLVVMNYIFTNCPDICPLSTNNMRLIQERIKKEKIESVEFVSVSFDPAHDSPEVLQKFAEIRNLDLSNWTFLTGEKSVINSLMNKIGIVAVVGDSTVFKDGRKIYYYTHTDRIQIIDVEGKIRKNYKGSTINTEEIVKDIKSLQ